jgi:rRNA maturation protein Nop10
MKYKKYDIVETELGDKHIILQCFEKEKIYKVESLRNFLLKTTFIDSYTYERFTKFDKVFFKKKKIRKINKIIMKGKITYDEFMEKYNLEHEVCPKCGSRQHILTLMGYVFDSSKPHEYKDLNKCECTNCGDKHIS